MKKPSLCIFSRMAIIILAVLACIITKLDQTDAATRYKRLFDVERKDGTIVQSGKYEFRYTVSSNHGVVSIRDRKNGSFQVTPINDTDIYANGKDAYYTKWVSDECVLYKYVFASRKEIVVTALPQNSKNPDDLYSDVWLVSMAYGNHIYLTRIVDEFEIATYIYHKKNNKLSKVKDNCSLISSNGTYGVSQDEYHTDVSAFPQTLYKFTASGLKKVRKLTKFGFNTKFIGKYLYYVSCSDGIMHKATLYKSKLNGSGKKKIASFKAAGDMGQVVISDITAKFCKVHMLPSGGIYKYSYATKKMKKIAT